MPDVVCNTSPLQYLHQLGALDVLRVLYGQIAVPQAVAVELANGRARGFDLPEPVHVPWISVEQVEELALLRAIPDLGRGEREALALGTRLRDPLVVLDDGLARQYARLLRLPVTGTLGVLVKAKQRGLLEAVRPLLERLDGLGFWVSAELRAKALELAGEPGD